MTGYEAELEDYRWLTGGEGRAWLERLAGSSGELGRQVKELRRSLNPARTHLVLEQLALRARARRKFAEAERLFFTERGLQQATDEEIARYKAGRFPAGAPVADLCCGIGGDLLALAARGPVLGVERDAVTALLAAANLHQLGHQLGRGPRGSHAAEIICRAVEEVSLAHCAGWHIDPDRRAAGHRVSHPSALEPPLESLETLLQAASFAAIKLAPATIAPAAWQEVAELEWIGSRGECRQQVAWFAGAARYPGRRVATVLPVGGGEPRVVVQQLGAVERPVRRPGRFLLEPHNAVLAAGLAPTLAAQWNLDLVAAGVAYLTADEPLADPALDVFEIQEIWPFEIRKLRTALRERRIGTLEIKKRGLPLDPAVVRKQLKLRGENAATLLIAPLAHGTVAILARRVPPGQN